MLYLNGVTRSSKIGVATPIERTLASSIETKKMANSDGLIKLLIRRNLIDADNRPTFVGHIVLTMSLLLFTGVSYSCVLWLSNRLEAEWLHKEVETPPLVEQAEIFNKQTLNPEDRQQIRIVEQLNTINDLKTRHCRIMSFFYKQYFSLLSLGGTAALVSLLCIFFISKEGWKDTNNALINVGVTSFGITALALNTTQIFQQSENLKTSQDLYSAYASLRNDLLSAVANQELITLDKAIKLDTSNGGYKQLIQYTDSRLKVLNLVRLGFDPTPISDLKSRLDSTIGTGSSIRPTVEPSIPPVPKASPTPTP